MAEPCVSLSRARFLFQYKNALLEICRGAYLCFEVLSDQTGNSPIYGYFHSCGVHVMIRFLDYLKTFHRGLNYTVTCYSSWSPCADCCEALVDFLRNNANVKLRIFVSRLYFMNMKKNREGLRLLNNVGAHLEVMNKKHFEYCWETFVDHQQIPFLPWDNIVENHQHYQAELTKILHKSLSMDLFLLQYKNVVLEQRRGTYLCFTALTDKTANCEYLSGYFHNICAGVHAEIRFLDYLKNFHQELNYTVTCYLSWSPCADCSEALVEFLRNNANVKLRIFVSRLYFMNMKKNRKGLRLLNDVGAHLEVMNKKHFEYCWKTFVDHQQFPFPPWDNIVENHQHYQAELMEILQQLPHPDRMNQPEKDPAGALKAKLWNQEARLSHHEELQHAMAAQMDLLLSWIEGVGRRWASAGGARSHQPQLPEPRLLLFQVPEPRLSHLHVPEPRLPQLQVPEPRLPQFQVPEPRLPQFQVPEPRLPQFQVPEPCLRLFQVPEPHLRLFQVPEPRLRLFQVPEPRLRLFKVPEPRLRLFQVPEPRLRLFQVPEPRLRLFQVPEPRLRAVPSPRTTSAAVPSPKAASATAASSPSLVCRRSLVPEPRLPPQPRPRATSAAAASGPRATSAAAASGPRATSAAAASSPRATSAAAASSPLATSAAAASGPRAASAAAASSPRAASAAAASSPSRVCRRSLRSPSHVCRRSLVPEPRLPPQPQVP
ncbi:uncharacterized protein LOC144059423 isoform X2 [Vanacampus margaritifer]